jgi:putative transposon-encoded protein
MIGVINLIGMIEAIKVIISIIKITVQTREKKFFDRWVYMRKRDNRTTTAKICLYLRQKEIVMVRTVLTPRNNNLVFSIPKEYVGRELEIIIFPTDDSSVSELTQQPLSKKATFNAVSVDTRRYKFNREEANAR